MRIGLLFSGILSTREAERGGGFETGKRNKENK